MVSDPEFPPKNVVEFAPDNGGRLLVVLAFIFLFFGAQVFLKHLQMVV